MTATEFIKILEKQVESYCEESSELNYQYKIYGNLGSILF